MFLSARRGAAMTWLSGSIVVISGLWLVGLAAAILITPGRAERFLTSFASSARAHYTEQALRLLAGAGIIVFAPEMRFPNLFMIFGWLLVVTAAGLLLIPWQWHNRFGEWTIPLAIKYKKFYAVGAIVLGGFILYGVI